MSDFLYCYCGDNCQILQAKNLFGDLTLQEKSLFMDML